jgi:hypothetical protein
MPAFFQSLSKKLENFYVLERVMNHNHIKQCEYITIQTVALFFELFILLDPAALGLEKALDRI